MVAETVVDFLAAESLRALTSTSRESSCESQPPTNPQTLVLLMMIADFAGFSLLVEGRFHRHCWPSRKMTTVLHPIALHDDRLKDDFADTPRLILR